MYAEKRYGLPYKGSKNGIAEWIVEQLPPADTLVDLFTGGCAVAHVALLSGKWRRVIANDILCTCGMFLKAVHGGFRDEKHWISREGFRQLRRIALRICLGLEYENGDKP